ncbi:hypothetical protein J6590_067989 [Homalodisca vitripennis]|nr:hypothetical protein J6590_067989 [Homalodisca vitripennis]
MNLKKKSFISSKMVPHHIIIVLYDISWELSYVVSGLPLHVPLCVIKCMLPRERGLSVSVDLWSPPWNLICYCLPLIPGPWSRDSTYGGARES